MFSRLGEKRNRVRARIKFLVSKLGIEKFRELVLEERKILPQDLLWTSYLKELPAWGEKPLKEGKETSLDTRYDDFNEWLGTNVMSQKQKGYAVAVVTLPLGDLNSFQLRQLAGLARRYVGKNVRTTVCLLYTSPSPRD